MNLASYKAFLSLGYWFSMRPVPMPRTWILGLTVFFCLFILGGVAFAIWSKKSDIFLARRLRAISKLGWTIGLFGFLWLFFSYEEAIVLGSRFWFLFLILGLLVRMAFIVRDIIKNLPKERALLAERARFEKYLPKKKK